jgi:hypothetical protein
MKFDQLIRFTADASNLIYFGKGSVNGAAFAMLRYSSPHGDNQVGALTGLDIVVVSCTWKILDVYYWEGPRD